MISKDGNTERNGREREGHRGRQRNREMEKEREGLESLD